jgi:hypothetical protein
LNTTTTTTTTTRRSTYVFPTRNRYTSSSRRPWSVNPTKRTASIKTTTTNYDEILDDDEYDGEFKYFKNIRKFFKEAWEDIKKFLKNLTGHDLIKAIQNFFTRKNAE